MLVFVLSNFFILISKHYIFQCSDIIDPNNSSQALIEYVNLKYIENNFRTIGLNTSFDKDNIEGAQQEFES